jgi:hypothetical protein
MVGLTAAFALAMWFAVRPALVRYFRSALRAGGGRLGATGLAVLLVSVLSAAIATNRIGIFAVFGAFLLGAVLSDQADLRRAAHAKLYDLVNSFFVPVFFAYTGLRTDVTAVGGAPVLLLCAAVTVPAVAGKLVGCGLEGGRRDRGDDERPRADGAGGHQPRVRTRRGPAQPVLRAGRHGAGDHRPDDAAAVVAARRDRDRGADRAERLSANRRGGRRARGAGPAGGGGSVGGRSGPMSGRNGSGGGRAGGGAGIRRLGPRVAVTVEDRHPMARVGLAPARAVSSATSPTT